MDLVDLIEQRQFLGSEFLTWIWFKSNCYDGLLDVGELGRVEVTFDDQLSLEAYLAETQKSDLRGGAPADTIEAKIALRQGKRVAKTKLRIIFEGREWMLTFKGENLAMSGIKTPQVLTQEYDERFYERMYLLDEMESIIGTLYEEFLSIRLSKKWAADFLPAIQRWINSDSHVDQSLYPA